MSTFRLFDDDAPNYASASFPPPRDFQSSAHDALRQGVRDGHRLQCVMAPTGSGKTYLGMRVIHETLLRGNSAMFLCDRTTLINQTSAAADGYGLSAHGIMQAQHWRADRGSKFQIASVQTIARRGWPDVDVIVIDECFVGETLIETTDGIIPISDVSTSHTVYNATGTGSVLSVFSKLSDAIVTVRLSNGIEIECTEDHPIFTDVGWVKAGILERGQGVFNVEAVRSLWCDDDATQREQRDTTGIRDGISSPSVLREILREEAEKPDALSIDTGEGVSNAEKNSASAEMQGRERDRGILCAKSCVVETGARLDLGIRSKNETEADRRISASLQDRCCEPGTYDCDRGGRRKSLFFVEAGAGREEGRATEVVWVESVTHSKSSSRRTVYNLRVSGHPSYFANGILVHNCHTLYAAWVNHVQECRAAVVGLSATPFSVGMGKLFTNLVNATSMHALTESGVLVPMRVFSCTKVNMAGAETLGKNGEWTDGAAAERGMAILGDVVTEWQRFGENRKTIVFGATIKHCEEMARQFNDSGVMAACFTSDTDASERETLLTEYRKPNSALRVLVSVEALAKGFDVPDVGCVCDVRPLRKSLSTAIQMWGRGLRSSPETGKTDCILLDFSGNIIRFADDFSTIFFDGLDALDMGEKLDKVIRKDDDEKPEGKACPSCGYKPMGKRCVACGHESKSVSLVEHEAGEMREVTIGKTKYAEDKLHLYMQACTYARGNSKPENQAGRAAHIFKSITGEWPARNWKFEDTPNATVTRPVLNKIRSQNIAFAHATGRAA